MANGLGSVPSAQDAGVSFLSGVLDAYLQRRDRQLRLQELQSAREHERTMSQEQAQAIADRMTQLQGQELAFRGEEGTKTRTFESEQGVLERSSREKIAGIAAGSRGGKDAMTYDDYKIQADRDYPDADAGWKRRYAEALFETGGNRKKALDMAGTMERKDPNPDTVRGIIGGWEKTISNIARGEVIEAGEAAAATGTTRPPSFEGRPVAPEFWEEIATEVASGTPQNEAVLLVMATDLAEDMATQAGVDPHEDLWDYEEVRETAKRLLGKNIPPIEGRVSMDELALLMDAGFKSQTIRQLAQALTSIHKAYQDTLNQPPIPRAR